jgi:hypothetical protein
MIQAIVIHGPKSSPKRLWMAFAALPRVGDEIRNVGKVERVYWMLDPEADQTRHAAPTDAFAVYYPFLYCDESNP